MANYNTAFNVDDGSIHQFMTNLIAEEAMKIQYTSKVKTLKDMTPEEIKKIELTYNAKVLNSDNLISIPKKINFHANFKKGRKK